MTLRRSRVGVLPFAMALVVAAVYSPSAKAAIIMDQIGTDPTVVTAGTPILSDKFQAALSADNSAVIDNFTLSNPTLITKVTAAVEGYGANFTDFSSVTGWGLEIYSSVAAAITSLNGDVFNRNFLPAGVSLTTPYGGTSAAALLSLTTAFTLPAGNYYLAVIAGNVSSSGFIGVLDTTTVSGSNPGDLNAVQVNPGGGLGFTNNERSLNADAAYAINGIVVVPEPTMVLGFMAGGAALALSRRNRVCRA